MAQPSLPYDIKYKIERLEAAVRELNRKRDRRPPNVRELQDVNGWGALNGYQLFYDAAIGKFKAAVPPPMVTFHLDGALSVRSSGEFPIPAPCTLFLTAGRLTTVGGSTSTALLKHNTTTIGTFDFTSGNNGPTTTPTILVPCVAGDYLWVDVTAAGSSAEDLVIPVWAMAGAAPS